MFKVGDIVKPMQGKKSSNNIDIKKLVLAKVIEVHEKSTYSKQQVRLQILEGTATEYYSGMKHKGDRIIIFLDSIQLAELIEEETELDFF